MRWMKSFLCLLVLSFPVCAKEGKPNILFIAIDDLRPELGCYGAKHIHSPNIDKLASGATLFEQAYCSVPTCGASRASLMTGVRPTPSRFLTYQAVAEKEVPWAVAMNQHFKSNGYRTLSYGKVFHSAKDWRKGWSENPWRSKKPGHMLAENRRNEQRNIPRGTPWESADQPDDAYQDGEIAAEAIKQLKQLAKKSDEPFFLAVGFKKPHLPFVAPRKYWDLYPLEKISLPKNYRLPEKAPAAAKYSWGELRNYEGIPKKGLVTELQARKLIQGYYACVSFVDAQVGRVLDALKEQGLDQNTVVVLWGDHGWNLGDHTYWCKHTVYESSLHIPLIVRMPGIANGKSIAAKTETVDIYPSLCELSGIPVPETTEGQSFVSRLRNPDQASSDTAYSRYQRGDSIREGDFRYSEYRDRKGKVTGRMLYDHAKDPLENKNIVDDPDQKERVRELAQKLKAIKSSTRK